MTAKDNPFTSIQGGREELEGKTLIDFVEQTISFDEAMERLDRKTGNLSLVETKPTSSAD